MLAGGRLKLGPKRKDSGFHRIHKLHQEAYCSENEEAAKISLLEKHRTNAENGENSREGAVLTLGSPRNHLHQINTTNSIGLRSKLKSNIQNIDGPDRLSAKENKQIQELKTKNQDLLVKIGALENEHKRLQDIVSAQEKQYSHIVAQDTASRSLAELEKQIATLRQENKGLRSRERPKENELENVDRAYYQKEIDRLRNLCDNLQIQGMENKHNSSLLLQQTKEHEKQITRKNQEIRNLQKQIEKQKMNLLEAKNQFNEKERGLRIAMEESEAANQVLSRSIEELTKQLQREETLRKEKAANVDNLQQQIDILLARARESENKCVKLRKTYQQQLSEQTRKMLAIEEQQREKNRESENMIYRLSSDIEQLKIQQSQQLAASKIVEQLRHEGQQISKELRIVRLEQQQKQLQLNIQNRDQIIQSLENKLKQYFSPEQYKGLQRRCKQLQEKRLSSARYYEEKLYNYQKENDQLRLAKIEQVTVESQPSVGFDQIVKKTLGQSQALRKEVKRMGDALAASKEEAAQIRHREKGYLNELEIMRKKVECSTKNFSIELEVEKQKLMNEIDSLKRKLTTAETRLEYKINQNKQKDEFIKSVIVGRSSPLERQIVMAELERIFLQRERRQVSPND